jgi:hypothetical protein
MAGTSAVGGGDSGHKDTERKTAVLGESEVRDYKQWKRWHGKADDGRNLGKYYRWQRSEGLSASKYSGEDAVGANTGSEGKHSEGGGHSEERQAQGRKHREGSTAKGRSVHELQRAERRSRNTYNYESTKHSRLRLQDYFQTLGLVLDRLARAGWFGLLSARGRDTPFTGSFSTFPWWAW